MNGSEVIQKHNPYEMAKANRIVVVLEPLGKISGYYNKAAGQRFIHINETLSNEHQQYVLSHILCPAMKDQDEMYFLTEKTLKSLLNR